MSNIKQLRGQMRQIVNELLSDEVLRLIEGRIRTQMYEQYKKDFAAMNDVMTKRMEAIEKRHNDIINMIMREVANKNPAMPALEEQSK